MAPDALPSYRVFLDLTGEVRFVEEPGRCAWFWVLWSRGDMKPVNAHIEECQECRTWMDRCDEISRQTQLASEAEENLRMLEALLTNRTPIDKDGQPYMGVLVLSDGGKESL